MTKNSAQIEQLAATIAEEIYLDIAQWHLYLGDAKLAEAVAEKLNYGGSAEMNLQALRLQLAEFKVKVGGGKGEIPLVDLIPERQLQRLLEIVHNFFNDD